MIRLLGDPVLSTPTHRVRPRDNPKEIEAIMLEAMKDAGGIGLAANQVGLSLSMFVMMLERGGTLTVINPKEESVDPEMVVFQHDGCLSVPGIFHKTKRHVSITLTYEDVEGNEHKAVFEGLEAVIVQHEMDHLSGRFYFERLGPVSMQMLLKKYRKLAKDKPLPKSST